MKTVQSVEIPCTPIYPQGSSPPPPDFLLRGETLFCPSRDPAVNSRLPLACSPVCLALQGGGGLPENVTAPAVGPHAESRQTVCEQKPPQALLPRFTHLPRLRPQGFLFPDWDRGGENKGIEVCRHGHAYVTRKAGCGQSGAAGRNYQKSPRSVPAAASDTQWPAPGPSPLSLLPSPFLAGGLVCPITSALVGC